ncbi:DUF5681 domain-containing protein [Marimonas lutisalis]|uniref:DUF5681 domain-containing protein n=1 Tax=Marimonas lutisalis TaxID=2545756 RepID=UPI0010F692CD|nr:DUF5681 domain-containing protein [Marimonas lutisalis]
MSEQEKDYEVGYGKPPKHSRFKKGQSGNPKGRPKAAKGLLASVKRELDSKITVREAGGEVSISKAAAMAKRLVANALQGDLKALLALLKLDPDLYGRLAAEVEAEEHGAEPEPVDYDIIRAHLLAMEQDGNVAAALENDRDYP